MVSDANHMMNMPNMMQYGESALFASFISSCVETSSHAWSDCVRVSVRDRMINAKSVGRVFECVNVFELERAVELAKF